MRATTVAIRPAAARYMVGARAPVKSLRRTSLRRDAQAPDTLMTARVEVQPGTYPTSRVRVKFIPRGHANLLRLPDPGTQFLNL